MKVLQINAVSGIRSTGRICVEIANHLKKNGDEAYIAYSVGKPYPQGYKIGNWFDAKYHALLSRILGTQAYFSVSATKKLVNYIHKLNPDIVHLGNLHSNFINLGILLKYLSNNNIPTVITLHDCWFYTGKCTHYTTENCFKWQKSCGNCPRIKKDNPSWFFDRTKMMHHDKKIWLSSIPKLAVIGVSDWITNEAQKSFLSSAKIITRIYNWIDWELFSPKNVENLKYQMGLQDKFIILGVASTWSEAKGLDKFIELAKIINFDMHIILVGRIPSKSNFILKDNITHIDETHNVSELVQYYSAADVYLHLSKEETFGKTIAEALSCGTPAIVYDSTACPEIVGEGCGYVLKGTDISELVEAILKIKSKNKSKYAHNCIKHVKKNFDYNTNLEKTTDVYKRLLSI